MCHWNVQHLTDSNLEELRVMFTKTETHVDILVITETFCSSEVSDLFYAIPGYNTYRKHRIGNGGGGILAYVKNSLNAKHRVDLEANDLEALWLEVCPYNSKRSLFIAGIYRPPSYEVDEDKKLGKNIENVYLLSKEMVLLGDFNVDYFAKGFHKHKLIKTLNNLNMSQLVNDITRPVSKIVWMIFGAVTRNVEEMYK